MTTMEINKQSFPIIAFSYQNSWGFSVAHYQKLGLNKLFLKTVHQQLHTRNSQGLEYLMQSPPQ